MSHRWVSMSRPDEGTWAECSWCSAGAYAQAKDGKIVIRYSSGIFPDDPEAPFWNLSEEPRCGGREGVYYDHDFDFLHEYTPRDNSYSCTRCGYKIPSDLSSSANWPEAQDCVDKKP